MRCYSLIATEECTISLNKVKIKKIIDILSIDYSDAKCGLNFKSPYELLVATVLSAQCTDIRVNMVTEGLFKQYDNPYKMAQLTEEQLQEKIKSCGLYKTKSKNILAFTRCLIEKYDGLVPQKMEELILLPGVGRKTANVVMANAFNIPAIAVDTHVYRVSKRIGLAKGDNVFKVEEELRKNIPKDKWKDTHHYLIWHGRKICKARKPQCNECNISEYCDYFNANI